MQEAQNRSASDLRREFERQYHDLFDWTSRYASLRVPHARDREDVVSEIVLRAWRRIDQYDPSKGSLRQWVAGIARRHVVDYWRSRCGDVELDDSVLAAFDPPAAETIDARRAFDRVLDGLSEDQRALFVLRYVDGLTHEEIAGRTGRHPTAIRSFFSRAVRDLRKRLDLVDA